MTQGRIRFFREWATYIFLFLLPWQTRWIISGGQLAGVPWEQGTVSLYITEILFWAILILKIIEDRMVGPAALPGGRKRLIQALPILIVSLALFHTATARDFSVALINTIHLVEGVALFLVILGSDRTDRAALAFVAGLLPAAVLGLGQFFFQTSPASTWLGLAVHSPEVAGASVIETVTGRFLRAYGPFPHPNIFGGYLAVALLLAARLVLSHRTVIRRLALFSAPPLAAALFFTFSRGAWLAFLAGAGLFILGGLRNSASRSRIIYCFAASTLPFLILGYLFFPLVSTRTAAVGRLESRSTTERIQGYGDALVLIRRHLFWGVGPGQASLAAYRDIDPARGPYAYEPVHNLFLLVWVELGFPGLLVLLLIWGVNLRQAISGGGLPLLAVLLILGLLDHYLWSYLPGVWLLWLGLGQACLPAGRQAASEGT